jgi:hypothetical protein
MAERADLEAARQRARIADSLEAIAEGIREMQAQQDRNRRAFARLLLATIESVDQAEFPGRDAVLAMLQELAAP